MVLLATDMTIPIPDTDWFTPIPNVAGLDAQLAKTISAVKQNLEVIAGVRGDGSKKLVTAADMVNSDYLNELAGIANSVINVVSSPGDYVYGDAPPPPTNLHRITYDTNGLTSPWFHHLEWDNPLDLSNVYYIEVWSSTINSISSAQRVAIVTPPQNSIMVYGIMLSVDYYYWIRSISYGFKHSPWEPSPDQGGYIVVGEDDISETIDSIIRALAGETPPVWESTIIYEVGDKVSLTTGTETRRFRAVAASANEVPYADGVTNTTYWERFGILMEGEVDGEATVAIDGNLVVDGTVLARHIAAEVIEGYHIKAGEIVISHIGDDAEILNINQIWGEVSGTGKPDNFAGSSLDNLNKDPSFIEGYADSGYWKRYPQAYTYFLNSTGEGNEYIARFDACGEFNYISFNEGNPISIRPGDSFWIKARVYESSSLNGSIGLFFQIDGMDKDGSPTAWNSTGELTTTRDAWTDVKAKITVTGTDTVKGTFNLYLYSNNTTGFAKCNYLYVGRQDPDAQPTAGAIDGNAAPSGAGLYLGADYMGFYNGAAWKTYMDSSGNFYLTGVSDNALAWNGTILSLIGSLTIQSGVAITIEQGGDIVMEGGATGNPSLLRFADESVPGEIRFEMSGDSSKYHRIFKSTTNHTLYIEPYGLAYPYLLLGSYANPYNAMALYTSGIMFLNAGGGVQVQYDISADNVTAREGLLYLKETTTPSTATGYGIIYTKSDNKLYFKDGGGTEHTVAFV